MQADLPDTVTYTADIKPILLDHCIDCHAAGGTQGLIGKADLSGYSNASAKVGSIIFTAVDLIYMPPGSRDKLTEYEKALIRKWQSDGLLE